MPKRPSWPKKPLPDRDVSGVCGYAIKRYGIKMVRDLVKTRKLMGKNYEIIGVGGVMQPKDMLDCLKAGADHVQCATAVIWNPYLAYETHEYLRR